ncbi:hypothetical protein ACJX0J_023099, partial [Zea mays]
VRITALRAHSAHLSRLGHLSLHRKYSSNTDTTRLKSTSCHEEYMTLILFSPL